MDKHHHNSCSLILLRCTPARFSSTILLGTSLCHHLHHHLTVYYHYNLNFFYLLSSMYLYLFYLFISIDDKTVYNLNIIYIYIHILYILLYIYYAAQHGKCTQILTNTPQLLKYYVITRQLDERRTLYFRYSTTETDTRYSQGAAETKSTLLYEPQSAYITL